MKKEIKLILTTVLILITRQSGYCQLIISTPNEKIKQQFFITIGLEPEITTSIGYTHVIGTPGKTLDWNLGASIKFAPLLVTKGAWRANLTTAAGWKTSEKWGVRTAWSFYLAHDNNRAAVMNGIGFEWRSAFIKYGQKWNKGIDAGWQYTAFTHIKNSNATKDTYSDRYPSNTGTYNGPKDGWYAVTASRFRLGFMSSVKFNEHLHLQIGAGSLFNIQKQKILLGFSHAQFPVYLETSLIF